MEETQLFSYGRAHSHSAMKCNDYQYNSCLVTETGTTSIDSCLV